MTEYPPPLAPDDLHTASTDDGAEEDGHLPSSEPLATGIPAVDEVLANVDQLDGLPLDEHLAAFERAHETLRSALDADPGEPA
jgi:hypothetical protein